MPTTKAIFERFAVTDSGDVIPGAEYTVVNELTGTNLTIYSSREGASKSPPYFATSAGLMQFYVNSGVTFRVAVTGPTGTFTSRYNLGFGTAAIMDAVGTVNATDTGALVQYGTGENGEFWRYAGGMQVCRHSFSIIGTTIATGITSVFKSDGTTWSFPIGFVNNGISVVDGVGRDASDAIEVWGAVRERSAGSALIRAYSNSNSSNMAMIASPIAIGRWK